uniref:Uncharacterized protein n=1 Tax=Anguilla anguilla TaxID=7936 RepID=A0A0E9WHD7_ANGAN
MYKLFLFVCFLLTGTLTISKLLYEGCVRGVFTIERCGLSHVLSYSAVRETTVTSFLKPSPSMYAYDWLSAGLHVPVCPILIGAL